MTEQRHAATLDESDERRHGPIHIWNAEAGCVLQALSNPDTEVRILSKDDAGVIYEVCSEEPPRPRYAASLSSEQTSCDERDLWFLVRRPAVERNPVQGAR